MGLLSQCGSIIHEDVHAQFLALTLKKVQLKICGSWLTSAPLSWPQELTQVIQVL